jgi:DNA-binding transcriptional MerR regulator
MNSEMIRIGHLASRIGVQPEAIRYYERRGLMPRPRRGPNGYRVYSAEDLERVEFIKRAQAMGLSLEEIREVMQLKSGGASSCQHVRDLLREKLKVVDHQIARLRAFRRELADSLETCKESLRVHPASGKSCPVLERLNNKPKEKR